MARPPRVAGFFRAWSPAMAYVLGYWWADGCMRVKRNTGAYLIEIASIDREHLLLMANAVGEKHEYRKITAKSECYGIEFCSKEMYNALLVLGGMPNKSNVIGFPRIPAEHLVHFVRGFVDGDGTLAWNGDRPVLQIYSGSKRLLEDMADAVAEQTGIPAPNVVANRSLWYLKWSTIRAKCLAAWLYVENPGLALRSQGCHRRQVHRLAAPETAPYWHDHRGNASALRRLLAARGVSLNARDQRFQRNSH